MCKECKIKLKAIFNAIYFLLIWGLIIVLDKYVEPINKILTINSGNILDTALNVVGTIVVYAIVIKVGQRLIKNYRVYKSMVKCGMNRYCSPFNPFC